MTQQNLPPHLQRFGDQLVTAARQRDAAAATRRRWRGPTLIATPVLAIAAAATVVLVTAAGPATPKAYALTSNGDGSYTVTINDVATAAPALNARFAQMGIDETVIAATSTCSSDVGIPPLVIDPQERTTDTLTFEPGRKYLAPGYDGYIAAEQLPDGQVALSIGAVQPPLPSCVSATPYDSHVTGEGSGTPTITLTPAPTSTTTSTTTGN